MPTAFQRASSMVTPGCRRSTSASQGPSRWLPSEPPFAAASGQTVNSARSNAAAPEHQALVPVNVTRPSAVGRKSTRAPGGSAAHMP